MNYSIIKRVIILLPTTIQRSILISLDLSLIIAPSKMSIPANSWFISGKRPNLLPTFLAMVEKHPWHLMSAEKVWERSNKLENKWDAHCVFPHIYCNMGFELMLYIFRADLRKVLNCKIGILFRLIQDGWTKSELITSNGNSFKNMHFYPTNSKSK